jgi:hypothetical protein
VSEREPLHFPDPELFGHGDAYGLYTRYATALDEAGFRDRLPADEEVRNVVIELLAERRCVQDLLDEPGLLDEAIAEATAKLEQRGGDSGTA